MNNGQQYPLDYDTLEKGSTIPVEECERITGVRRDKAKYPFALLHLRGRIMRDMKRRGVPVTVKITNGGLDVLTDAQASAYNARLQKQGIRRHFRGHARNLGVDVTKLTPEELRAHEKRLLSSGRIVQAIRSTRQQIKLEVRQRTAPALADK